jgi:very-long-chain enoyl-CoA reductase
VLCGTGQQELGSYVLQLWLSCSTAIPTASLLPSLLPHFRSQEGSKERRAPGGPLFALVSCPNYTAEVLGWVGFSIMTQIAGAYLFTLVGFAQMTQWALQKHVGYIRSDPTYKKLGRKAIVPFVI